MSRKYYINYADKTFQSQQKFATRMAKLIGGFDETISYSPLDIDKEFYKENLEILNQQRGGGFWLWKPYFILKTLLNLEENDYLFYSDSGAFLISNIQPLIDEMKNSGQDILGFELPLIEKQWTKKELFVNMSCQDEKFSNTNQIMGGFILIKKTVLSMKFIEEFLNYSKNTVNITDTFDISVIQDSAFITHRHDQSIFSLLYKKYNLRPFKDATPYGEFPENYSGNENFSYEYNKLYKLDNKRLFFVKKYEENYGTLLILARKGNVFRFIASYILGKYFKKNRAVL